MGDQLPVKARLVHLTISGDEGKPPLIEDSLYHQIITNSEIPRILKKYGFDYRNILLDNFNWSLLEQPAPELCVDRIDYTLRDMYHYEIISIEEIEIFLDNLIIREGKIYLKDIKTAEWFVSTYYKEVIDFFMNPLNIYGYDFLAKTLKIALDKKIININTLLGTDEEVMNLLRLSNDIDVKNLLNHIHQSVIVEEDKVEYHLHRKNKVRLIDPSIVYDDQLKPSSEMSIEIKKMNENAKRIAEEGMYVKIISN